MEQELNTGEKKNKYRVIWKRKIEKQIAKMPEKMQNKFYELVSDIRRTGPIQKSWPNFSDLGKDLYHCHLGYSWVACWTAEKNEIIVEVYYVGSREQAPY
ncbi:MAG: hypothetical protein K5751_12420 [Treponemataceae bacterium]|nr:hypothetical protein [Treponemataceae bacterium]